MKINSIHTIDCTCAQAHETSSKKLSKLIGQSYVNELDMPGKRVQLITEQDLGIQTMKKLR